MSNCIFCKIGSGEFDASRIYEDDVCFVIMDIHPINTGHALVIPKTHEPDFYNLAPDIYTHCMQVAQRVAKAVHATVSPLRTGLMIAGFDVPHTHIHIVPMHDAQDLTSQHLLNNTCQSPTREELDTTSKRIAQNLT